ncbi:YccF domain-containing protein [Pedobacter sp. KR3-3]|uniref:YccF domain-containing protein n=1 Tax=Pedobacter albus TaxID=3113905 RepID=A0ABU7IB30_9SPHI|nr:YccF domain-containing protein [Pedobacter sp. KR3-3]MEE1946680.1 YccF domain-containing protein [Pedobacter sp. KR3-3]
MNLIGNIIWIIFGGLLIFFQYIFGGLILCLTIVGIPFGIQCFKFAIVGLAPFGVKITNTSYGVGCLSTIMNIIWLIFGGLSIVLTHLVFGLLLCITIVGIPFGLQHFKLMSLAFSPFGKSIS